ncbi:c-type cytochrome [Maritimibacter sp. UBA3975]|uniref:c-type cytochrome n=1 Tax=Maritimibacter sp. UBA3975 TaxID=1946833 RepID=UPI000C0B47BA|nr:c-type cytochrome [Maritimibacter sp. UBA3975]MAM60598.1 diacylglycerol kinase [Maritimibacter sp.]|tara:strand:- start:28948 stop:29835 length:888 start_codon:yes stop_codon:yes gene_type:complete
MRLVLRLIVLVVIVAAIGLWFTRPKTDGPEVLAGLTADPAHGETVFTASGCASCHMAKGFEGEAKLVLSGGQEFPSPFGTFHAPNISMDPDAGIGDWTAIDLWNALHHGTSPDNQHYYPVLPYGAYIHLDPQDVVDLHAYMQDLPADATPSQPHDISFPFNIRLALGGWKLLFLNEGWAMEGDLSPELTRGRELVEAMGHCAECHTPRNALGGLKEGANWLTGAPNPAGRGTFPDLTPPEMSWSEAELVEYFTSGFTPEFDTAGGHMALVVENLAALPEEDRAAIAAYIKALPIR